MKQEQDKKKVGVRKCRRALGAGGTKQNNEIDPVVAVVSKFLLQYQ